MVKKNDEGAHTQVDMLTNKKKQLVFGALTNMTALGFKQIDFEAVNESLANPKSAKGTKEAFKKMLIDDFGVDEAEVFPDKKAKKEPGATKGTKRKAPLEESDDGHVPAGESSKKAKVKPELDVDEFK